MPKTTQYPQLHHEILHAEMYQRPCNTPGCTTRLCRLSCTSPSICKKESTRIAKWAQMIRKMLGKKSANDHLTFWVYKAVMEENIHRLQCVWGLPVCVSHLRSWVLGLLWDRPKTQLAASPLARAMIPGTLASPAEDPWHGAGCIHMSGYRRWIPDFMSTMPPFLPQFLHLYSEEAELNVVSKKLSEGTQASWLLGSASLIITTTAQPPSLPRTCSRRLEERMLWTLSYSASLASSEAHIVLFLHLLNSENTYCANYQD